MTPPIKPPLRGENFRRSVAMIVRDEIARWDFQHRKGFRLSDFDGQPIDLEHLFEEFLELEDALKAGSLADQQEECADVFACVLQVASRLGMTFPELDALAEHKLRTRFEGGIGLPPFSQQDPR